MKKTDFQCPLCKSALISYRGTRINADDGYTLRCENMPCPCSENVEGHGRTEARAYEVILAKYTGSRMSLEADEEPEVKPAAVEKPQREKPKIDISAPVAIKRGRGRPRKIKAVASETETVIEEELPL